jgi:uncharacterized protein (TIGR02646 family)
MKQILKKGRGPNSLSQLKARGGTYDNLTSVDKDELRNSLLLEQGYICCYCMKRIPESGHNPGCKVEHVNSQRKFPAQQLDYDNLLIACLGGMGLPKHLQTCDTFKGESKISFNPANKIKNIEKFIKYTAFGEIYSDDLQINYDINKVLNLNNQTLRKNRQVIYEEVKSKIRSEGKNKKGKIFQANFYKSLKKRYLSMVGGQYEENCMLRVYLCK